MKKQFDISEGQKVYLVPTGNHARRLKPGIATITTIGRKYFYAVLDDMPYFGRIKFDFDAFKSHYDDNSGFDIHESQEAYERFLIHKAKCLEIESALSWCRHHNTLSGVNLMPSYEAIDRIYDILKSEDGIQMDKSL